MRHTIATLLLLAACGSANEDDPSDAPSGAATTDATDDACTPGYEGCACAASACLSGLVCLSDLCVEPPMPPPNDDGGMMDSGDDSPSAPNPCVANSDCAWSAICWDGACDDAWSHAYEVRVTGFSGCQQDGWGGAEMYYDATVDDEVVLSSSTSGCPAAWPDDAFRVDTFDGAFALEFWELDAFSDDLLATLCWDTFGTGSCGPVPKQILHDEVWLEEWSDADGDLRWVELELQSVQ